MKNIGILFVGLLLILSAVIGCAQQMPPEEAAPPAGEEIPLAITSTAFADGANIPVKYTCSGGNLSPPLAWGKGPMGTASFALIMDDPDATVGVFNHWVVFNLPSNSQGLVEGITKDTELAGGGLQGKNAAQRVSYVGPCPPIGPPHHYTFTLYALDITLDLSAGATKKQVLEAMEGHILGEAQLVGLYQR
jgi:Raf kinase inhibitor-like YbhB/YbcL family protein